MSPKIDLNVILSDITLGLELLNAVEPEIATIIALFTNTQRTIQQMLADANAVENADITKIKTELDSSEVLPFK